MALVVVAVVVVVVVVGVVVVAVAGVVDDGAPGDYEVGHGARGGHGVGNRPAIALQLESVPARVGLRLLLLLQRCVAVDAALEDFPLLLCVTTVTIGETN